MEANLMLLLATGALVAAGVYLLLDRAMTKMLMGILLIGNGANLLMLQAGGPPGSPPIMGRDVAPYGERIADPLAQGMILTAIVISMALTAFILTLAYRQYRYRSADIIEDDTEDAAIAAIATKAPASASADMDASADPATGRATKQGDSFGPRFFEGPVEDATGGQR
ncbi:Na(+)/H(+) antiporter subunit C [Corynebacterium lizhenjunii]|uniref:Na(+)/H(+) antiporter subunit C n=1 Tax=Corynebacterium lizhenjunii TaxID=2709394 RepID=A0A7T0KDS3_9CORY|nr:Na(+)/H(+) antiporter subunit C [Corynebacterium lizhenjunii]QPK78921.1 Na(+)/H(+) antiporter subunit C [Corynebacterium lizhenjunii]